MCIETTTTFRNCVAVQVHTWICLAFIEHTRQQVDNERCVKFQRQFVSDSSTQCMCRDGGRCIKKIQSLAGDNGHMWTFEKEGAMRMPTERGVGLEAERIDTAEEVERHRFKKILQSLLAKKYELVKCSEIMEEVVARQSSGKRRKTSLPNAQAVKAPSAPISVFGSSVDDMAVDDVVGRIKKEDDEDIPIAVPEYKKEDDEYIPIAVPEYKKEDDEYIPIAVPEYKKPARISKLEIDIMNIERHFLREGWAYPSDREKLLFMPDHNLQERIDQFKEIHLGPPVAPRAMRKNEQSAKEAKAQRKRAKKEAKKEAKKIKEEPTVDVPMEEHENYKMLEDSTGM